MFADFRIAGIEQIMCSKFYINKKKGVDTPSVVVLSENLDFLEAKFEYCLFK